MADMEQRRWKRGNWRDDERQWFRDAFTNRLARIVPFYLVFRSMGKHIFVPKQDYEPDPLNYNSIEQLQFALLYPEYSCEWKWFVEHGYGPLLLGKVPGRIVYTRAEITFRAHHLWAQTYGQGNTTKDLICLCDECFKKCTTIVDDE